jgi:transposase
VCPENLCGAVSRLVGGVCATLDIAQVQSFAIGIRQDYAAIRAALETAWSNGQTEGQVNRLKFIKRQMYGRARFDLLRLRVLHPP